MSTSSRPDQGVGEPSRFRVGQTVTVFRSRLRPDADGYPEVAEAMETTVRTLPGFVDVKTFTAEDGERVTVATFADLEAFDAWRRHEAHRTAQRRGRDDFYLEYSIQTGTCDRVRHWIR